MAGEAQFSKGMEVEVCSDDKELRGAWFVATVLRSTSRRTKVLVEYQTLLAEEKNDSKPLRELVPVVNLRPIPPRELNRCFNLSDEVDAFHNDGWWEGVVTRVLGEDNSRYLVYFRTGKEELEFGPSDLRIHREWVRGSWVPPLVEEEEADQLPQQDIDATHNEAAVRIDQARESLVPNTASIANESNNGEQEIERSSPKSNNSGISPPCKKLKKGEVIKAPLLLRALYEKAVPTTPTIEGEKTPLQGNKEISQNLADISSTPSDEGQSDLVPNFAQEKIAVLGSDRPVTNPSVDHFSLSPLTTPNPTKESLDEKKKEITKNFNDIIPTPSEAPSDHVALNFGQEKTGSVLDRDRFGINPSIDDISLPVPAISNTKGEEIFLKEKKEIIQNLADIIPSPSEGLSDHVALKICQEKTVSVLHCDRSESDTSIDDLSLSTPTTPNTKGDETLLEEIKEKQNLTDTITSPGGLTDQLAPNFGKEKIVSGLDCDGSGSHPTTDEFSLSLPSNAEGAQHESSRTQGQCSQTSLDVQSLPLSFILQDQQQCKRTGKRWRCSEMALHGKQHCEKHLLEQNTRNEKRRKRPIEQCRFFMAPFIPSDDRQRCRRNGKGWRCSEKAPPRERYCEKHQIEQNSHNEKRRKRTIERSCPVTSGSEERSNSNGDHLLNKEQQQCGRVDKGTKPNQSCAIEPFVPSDDQQQCRRTTKGWRCPGMAPPRKRYCEKHQLEQNKNNEKRRKRIMERCDDQQQCRRTTKGWRCPGMAPPRKRYCEKHQLEQNKNNEKRRKRIMERCGLVTIGSEEQSNSNGDQQQCGVADINAKPNEADAKRTDEVNLSKAGNSAAVSIDIGNDSDRRKKEMGGFLDEFWLVNVEPVYT